MGETPSLTGEYIGETHRVLECTQTHPLGNQHQKTAIYLWVVGGERLKAERKLRKWHCSISDPSPTYSATTYQLGLPCLGKYLRPRPLLCNRCTKTKKIQPKWKNRSKIQKKTSAQGDSQPIWWRVQNTSNQDTHRNGWVWPQNKGRSEGYTKWNKKKIFKVLIMMGRKLGLKSASWSRRKK